MLLWLDIVICVIFSAGLIYFAEASAYPLLVEYQERGVAEVRGSGRYGGGSLRDDGYYKVYLSREKPASLSLPDDLGEYIPEKLMRLLPASIGDLRVERRIDVDAAWAPLAGVVESESVNYLLLTAVSDGWVVVQIPLGLQFTVFSWSFSALIVLQLLSLLSTFIKNNRSIKRALRPYQELTVSARALSAKSTRQSQNQNYEGVQRLTGALDSFNVRQLDARLPLSGINDDLKPLAAAINEMISRIDEAYREQIRFVSDASHELRTPIAVIKGYADILSRWGSQDPDTLRESIAAISHEADSMKGLVEQLLFLARGESELIDLEFTAVDMSALGAEVIKEVRMIDDRHIFLDEIAPSVPVNGDEGMLKQLLRILVDNSIKYTPDGGKIILRVEERNSRAIVSVQDEGAGIPEEAIPRIFDRFYRADESRNRETGGAGLGLSIAQWIADKHRGAIEVTSRVGIGTRMTLLLPLYDDVVNTDMAPDREAPAFR